MIYLFDVNKRLKHTVNLNQLSDGRYTQEINGLYTFDAEMPIIFIKEDNTIINHKIMFDESAYIGHFDIDDNFQMYKIYNIKVNGDMLTVKGVHIFFDEAKSLAVIEDARLVDTDARGMFNTVFKDTGWSVKNYDTTPYLSQEFYKVVPTEARATIIDLFKVEIHPYLVFNGQKITNKHVDIRLKMGNDTANRFAYGHNAFNVTHEQNKADIYTAAIGRGASNGLNNAIQTRIEFHNIVWSKAAGNPADKPAGSNVLHLPERTQEYGHVLTDGTLKPRIGYVTFDEIGDAQVLLEETYKWLNENSRPKFIAESTIEQIGESRLGDRINFIYKKVDLYFSVRIFKVENNLLDPTATIVELGDYEFFNTDKAAERLEAQIEKVKTEAKGWLYEQQLKFDDEFKENKAEMEERFDQIELEAEAKVQAAETRMTETIDKEFEAFLSDDNIPSSAIKVDALLADKLLANDMLTDKLLADTAYIREIKTKSLEAVYADVAKLRTDILIADSVTAKALKVEQALIDKLLVDDLLANSITAKSAFISNIKAIDIDLNRATVKGSIGTNYLQLTADELTQYGTYTRTWRGVTSTENVFTRFKNGYVRFRNNDKNRSLYMSEFGISTYVDGEGEGGGSSGTIQWWDPKYSPTNAFGITVNSYGGVAALTSDTNRTMIDSYLSVNLESTTAPINFKPEKNNSGNNSFQLSIVDAAHPTDTDGFLMYGSEVNGWGAGLRFSKSASEQTVYVVNGSKERGGNATLDAGIVKANDVQTRSGSYSVYWNGSSGGTTGGVSGLQNLYATGIKTRGTDSDMYLATQNGGWVRVTDGYGYNNGGTITYRGIAVSEYKTMSHHLLKHEITEWDYDVLEVIKNEWITYQYKLKNDPSGEFKRGTVVGGGYSTIPELIDGEGVKMYEMATWMMEGIKQLAIKNDEFEKRINLLIEKVG